jgi:hypothetical protein
MNSPAEATNRLLGWGAGDEQTLEQLLPVVIGSCFVWRAPQGRRVSRSMRYSPGLVNEAYLRLIDVRPGPIAESWLA